MDKRTKRLSNMIGKALENDITFDQPTLLISQGELFIVIKDNFDNLVVEEVAGAILEDDSDSDFIDSFEYNGSISSSAMSAFDDWFEVEAEAKEVPANIIKNLFEPYDPSNYKKRRGKEE